MIFEAMYGMNLTQKDYDRDLTPEKLQDLAVNRAKRKWTKEVAAMLGLDDGQD
jgi:hypothetical protein